MPLEKDPLSDEEIRILHQWVKEGANWETHWAYIPPEKPQIPSLSKTKENIHNEIDAYILARLEQEKVQASPEAAQCLTDPTLRNNTANSGGVTKNAAISGENHCL